MIIFDYDGVIADSFAWFLEALNDLSEKYRFNSVADDEVASYKALGTHDILRRLNVDYYKIPFLVRDLRARAAMASAAAKIQLYPDMPEVLKALRHTYDGPLGLLTSNAKSGVLPLLQQYDLEIFDYYSFGSSLFGKRAKLKQMIKNSGAERVWYIGDEVRDVQAANGAGISSVFVTWGYNSVESLATLKNRNQPDRTVHSPSELLSIFS